MLEMVVLRWLQESVGAHCVGRGFSRVQVQGPDAPCLRKCPVHYAHCHRRLWDSCGQL